MAAVLKVGLHGRNRLWEVFRLVQNVVVTGAVQKPDGTDGDAAMVVHRIKAVHVDFLALGTIEVKDFESDSSLRKEDVFERAQADVVDLGPDWHD